MESTTLSDVIIRCRISPANVKSTVGIAAYYMYWNFPSEETCYFIQFRLFAKLKTILSSTATEDPCEAINDVTMSVIIEALDNCKKS